MEQYKIDHRERVSTSLRNWAIRLREGTAQDHEDAFRRLADAVEITADCPAERDTALMDGTRVVQAAQRCVHAAEDFARDLEGLATLIMKPSALDDKMLTRIGECGVDVVKTIDLVIEACK